MHWGILAPDTIVPQRRQQSLGLGNAVRHFNDRSVPGLGGMWYPMPILWSVLAVSIAVELGEPALPVGNAIEALMMRDAKDGPVDPRVRGVRKLQSLDDWSFRNLKRRDAYVVQPIRMAMVQPLVALGFVQGRRYGSFQIHSAGDRMLRLSFMQEWRAVLLKWALGQRPHGLSDVISALSPTAQVRPEARKMILERVIGADPSAARRRSLASIGTGPTSNQLDEAEPLPGIALDHWTDMRAGAAFMDLRAEALKVLGGAEKALLQLRDANKPAKISVEKPGEEISTLAQGLRELGALHRERIDAGGEVISRQFLSEMTGSTPHLLRRLVERDGSVVRMQGDHIVLGPAAGEVPGRDSAAANSLFAPQLFRLYNLHCLVTELEGGSNPGCETLLPEASFQ